MPQPNKIPLAFASSGDKNVIPESTETTGLASWRDGFPAITSAPFSEGGIAPKRADFNGIFNALSLATVWQQQGGFYAYDATTDYEVGNVVVYFGELYICLVANGPNTAVKNPTQNTFWSVVPTFEYGTFTPTISGGTTPGSFTFSNQSGNYIRIKELCYIDFGIEATVVTVPTGAVNIGGLPYRGYNVLQSVSLYLANFPSAMFSSAPLSLRIFETGANIWGLRTNRTLNYVGFDSPSVGDSVTFRGGGIYRIKT